MRRRDERGLSASVEAAIILPAIILFVGLLIVLARIALAQQSIGVAASSAARAASLERSESAGQRAAREAALANLGERSVSCRRTDVDVDASGLGRTLGSFASVEVRLTCSVELSDVSLPLMPGTVEVSATRTAPIDPLRGN